MVPRLGFPEIILPGDVRNDIYLILDKAEFEKGAKSAERNVEIAVTVCDEQGRPVEVIMTTILSWQQCCHGYSSTTVSSFAVFGCCIIFI